MGNGASLPRTDPQNADDLFLGGHTLLAATALVAVYRGPPRFTTVVKRGGTQHAVADFDDPLWRNVRFLEMVRAFPPADRARFVELVSVAVMRTGWRAELGFYEYRVAMTDGGEPLNLRAARFTVVPARVRYALLLQVWRIVEFLVRVGAAHTDLHAGNFLVRGRDAHGVPRLVLVDYDDVYTRDDEKHRVYERECTMVAQVSGIMADVPQTSESVEDARRDGTLGRELSAGEKLSVIGAARPDVAARATAVLRTLELDTGVDLADALYLDYIKAADPVLHRLVYGLPPDAPVHTWFGADDIAVVHRRAGSVSAIVEFFEGRLRQAELDSSMDSQPAEWQ